MEGFKPCSPWLIFWGAACGGVIPCAISMAACAGVGVGTTWLNTGEAKSTQRKKIQNLEAIAKLPAAGKPRFCRPLHPFRLACSIENVLVGTERADKSALAMDDKIIDFPGRGSFAIASIHK